MTATRLVDTISTSPGGKTGEEWTQDASDSIGALWGLNGGMLTSVDGVNDITGNVAVSTGFTNYSDGLSVGFLAAYSNSGPCTLNLNSLGSKGLRDYAGDALSAGDIAAGGYYEAVFDYYNDIFRIKSSSAGGGSTSSSGGIIVKRSAIYRLPAIISSTAAQTIVSTRAFACTYTTSSIRLAGSVERYTTTGTYDDDGTTIGLYVDSVLEESFLTPCRPSLLWSTPFVFDYTPGDTDSHTYQIRVTSTIAATYSLNSCFLTIEEVAAD